MRLPFSLPALAVLLAGLVTASASAQTDAPSDRAVTAVFAEEAPRIDGRLDDAIWSEIAPVTAFTQVFPNLGSAATEDTEVRIAYDQDYLYFGFRNLDRAPSGIVARNLERGGPNSDDDHLFIGLDTYRDGRNAYLFEINALGTQDDALITDENLSFQSFSWDAIFLSETHIDEDGWSAELAIPFRQLRFPEGEELSFGLMLHRGIRRKNERVSWPAINREGFSALSQVSQYGVLRGIRGVRRGRNLEIKPYAISGVQQDRLDLTEPTSGLRETYDFGLDVKWGVTSNLTLDATVNTDFAQVEADAAQINLTRFSLFFPEQREFFLERAGLFEHGSGRTTQTFFSRRIGLEDAILAGARLTGQIGPLSVGVLNIETGPQAPNTLTDFNTFDKLGNLFGSASANNTVARVRADVLPRTTVGGIVTNLAEDERRNTALGVDGQVRFGPNSEIGGWATQVWDTAGENSAAGQIGGQLANNRVGVFGSFSSVGRAYDPALGFVRRRDYRRVSGGAFLNTPLAGTPLGLQRVGGDVDGTVYWGLDGDLQSSEVEIETGNELVNGDEFGFGVRHVFERLDEPFSIREGETVPAGDYGFVQAFGGIETDQGRAFSAGIGGQVGGFFSGTQVEIEAGVGWRPSPGLAFRTEVGHSVIDIGNGPFTATLGRLSASTAFSRDLFGQTLLQYDNFSRQLRANVRFNWIHTPGSDLFVVFNTAYGIGEDDPLDPRREVLLRDRVGVVKLTYLVLL
ncbi:MAG: DUF5916 domain-containing protein [Bacteroidota bacterium]